MGAKKSIGKWTLAALAAYELTLAGISLTPVAGKGTSSGNRLCGEIWFLSLPFI